MPCSPSGTSRNAPPSHHAQILTTEPLPAAILLAVVGTLLVESVIFSRATVLTPGDHVYVFARTDDLPFIQLMFGQPESK